MRVAINSKIKATARACETLEDINWMREAKRRSRAKSIEGYEGQKGKMETEISHRAPKIAVSQHDHRLTMNG